MKMGAIYEVPNNLTDYEKTIYYEGFRKGYFEGCKKSMELLAEAKSLLPPAPIMVCAVCHKSLEEL